MVRMVFFADVLGFSSLSRSVPEAAVEALSDIATLLSEDHPVARYLNRFAWEARYALSDSIFLVGVVPSDVCRSAAEFFFNLAFYVAEADRPLLLRGAVALGEVRYADPIFPTATSNLVGEAVVEAVSLERLEPKGPRLYVSDRVAAELAKTPLDGWLLSRASDSVWELLWLLPPDPAQLNLSMLERVCASAIRWFERYGQEAGSGAHYVGYVDLMARSLLRLKDRTPDVARALARRLDMSRLVSSVSSLPPSPPRDALLTRLASCQ